MKKVSSVLVTLVLAAGGVAVASSTADAAGSVSATAAYWAASDSRPAVQALSKTDRSKLQSEIDQQLAATRGGVQISANEVSYNGGDPIVALPLPGSATAPASSAQALKQQGATPTQVQQLTQSPDSLATDWHNCPAGAADNRWYCFYEDADFLGKRLQWNYEHCYDKVYFNNYGFENRTSGWVNTGVLTVRAFDTSSPLGPALLLWTEPAYTMASYIGDYTNDKADYFTACK
ncbi:hypothetical protein ACFC26_12725 [Kitasatospora purpeofusca]|uniref:hypothetical protein n=1 Tax=Kitasatospora purpeofusca TaxID=67352 RepID=UPI0035E2BC0E